MKFTITVGIDFHFGLVAHLHIDDIVLVDIDARFHVTEVSHAHYFRARKLPRGHKTFALFTVENCDCAIDGGIDGGLRQLIARLT